MFNKSFFFGLLLLLVLGTACKTRTAVASYEVNTSISNRVGFYNVENLFDIKDDPERKDEEFMPDSEKKWTEVRYQDKLSNIAKVIAGIDRPALMGLCEVENAAVLQDLVRTPALTAANYAFVHQESPDFRGIDVALLYSKSVFKVLEEDIIRINFPKEIVENYLTRDILYVRGLYRGKTELHVLVNHWPSRYGGVKKSEPKRTYVAEQLRKKVDTIFAKDTKANILIVGDFNDETDNRSVQEVLSAQPEASKIEPRNLYNCLAKLDKAGQGTYNYRGNLNVLDQVIVSSTLADTKKLPFVGEAVIFNPDWLSFKHPKYGKTPNRTYGGTRYFGGFSDHYAVYVDLEIK